LILTPLEFPQFSVVEPGPSASAADVLLRTEYFTARRAECSQLSGPCPIDGDIA